MRKILYSPGYGAGWSTWNSQYDKKLVCEYVPIIEALEREENLLGENGRYGEFDVSKAHPAIQQFDKELRERYGQDIHFYYGGLEDLAIHEVGDNVQVRIDEYDGNESVVTGHSDYF